MREKTNWLLGGVGFAIGAVIAYVLYMMTLSYFVEPPTLILLIIAFAPAAIGAKFALLNKESD